MIRVLFYGGCHALTMQKIFQAHCLSPGAQFDCIVNFQMIAARKPFPYAELSQYDAVVFSPIENKQDYTTDVLIAECRKLGIKTVQYPWVQWNGYFPYILNAPFVTASIWHHGALPFQPQTLTFDEFQESLHSVLLDEVALKDNIRATTERLVAQEERTNCDIRISNFISANYKKHRLFLTPDHPGKKLYDHLVQEVASRLSLEIDETFFWGSEEPQAGIRLPIPSEISRVLDLSFCDADFQNFMSDLGERHIPYSQYVRLLYGVLTGAKIYRSVSSTPVKADALPASDLGEKSKFFTGESTLIQLAVEGEKNHHVYGQINWSNIDRKRLSSADIPTPHLFLAHWKERPATMSRW